MASPRIRNIALVGAGGNLGSLVLKHLLASKEAFKITIISRPDSSSIFPEDPSITVKAGSYDSDSFLKSAFSGNDAVVFALHYTAVPDMEIRLIEAAAAAGIKWIFPTEFGNDTDNEGMVDAVPIHPPKVRVRQVIEHLSKQHEGLKWAGLITNPWFDFVCVNAIFLTNVISCRGLDTDFFYYIRV